jgi:hypothetical protein
LAHSTKQNIISLYCQSTPPLFPDVHNQGWKAEWRFLNCSKHFSSIISLGEDCWDTNALAYSTLVLFNKVKCFTPQSFFQGGGGRQAMDIFCCFFVVGIFWFCKANKENS